MRGLRAATLVLSAWLVAVIFAGGAGVLRSQESPEEPELSAEEQRIIDTLKKNHLERMRVKEAWEIAGKGKGVTIALIDTGVDAEHPRLKGKVLDGVSLIEPKYAISKAEQEDEEIVGRFQKGQFDPNGHGTEMALLMVGEEGDGEREWSGVAPEASVFPIYAYDPTGTKPEVIVKAIEAAVAAEVQVVCLSMAGGRDFEGVDRAIETAWQEGIVVVVPAGNGDGEGFLAPGRTSKHCFVATTEKSELGYQQQGWNMAIPTVFSVEGDLGDLTRIGGGRTSAASAILAGCTAILRSAHPDETPEKYGERIRQAGEVSNLPSVVLSQVVGLVDLAASVSIDEIDPFRVLRAHAWRIPGTEPNRSVLELIVSSTQVIKDDGIGVFVDGEGIELKIAAVRNGAGRVRAVVGTNGDTLEGLVVEIGDRSIPIDPVKIEDPPHSNVELEIASADVVSDNEIRLTYLLSNYHGESVDDLKLLVPSEQGMTLQDRPVKGGEIITGEVTVGFEEGDVWGRVGYALAIRSSVLPKNKNPMAGGKLPILGDSTYELQYPDVANNKSYFGSSVDEIPIDVAFDAPWSVAPGRGVPFLFLFADCGSNTWVSPEFIRITERKIEPTVRDGSMLASRLSAETVVADIYPLGGNDDSSVLGTIVDEGGVEGVSGPDSLFPGNNAVLWSGLRGRHFIVRSSVVVSPGEVSEFLCHFRFHVGSRTRDYYKVLRVHGLRSKFPGLHGFDQQHYLDVHTHTLNEWTGRVTPLVPKKDFGGPLQMLVESAYAMGMIDAPTFDAAKDRVITTDHNEFYNHGEGPDTGTETTSDGTPSAGMAKEFNWSSDRPPKGGRIALNGMTTKELRPQMEIMRETFGRAAGEEVALSKDEVFPISWRGYQMQASLSAHMLAYETDHLPGLWHGGIFVQKPGGERWLGAANINSSSHALGHLKQHRAFGASHPYAILAHPYEDEGAFGLGMTQMQIDRLLNLLPRDEQGVHTGPSGHPEAWVVRGIQSWNQRQHFRREGFAPADFYKLNPFDSTSSTGWERTHQHEKYVEEGVRRYWHLVNQGLQYQFAPGTVTGYEDVGLIRKVYFYGGTDAHGDFNYSCSVMATAFSGMEQTIDNIKSAIDRADEVKSTLEFVATGNPKVFLPEKGDGLKDRVIDKAIEMAKEKLRAGNEVNDSAWAKVRTLVLAEKGEPLDRLKHGNAVVTDGPVMEFSLDSELRWDSEGLLWRDTWDHVSPRAVSLRPGASKGTHKYEVVHDDGRRIPLLPEYVQRDGMIGGDGRLDTGLTMLYACDVDVAWNPSWTDGAKAKHRVDGHPRAVVRHQWNSTDDFGWPTAPLKLYTAHMEQVPNVPQEVPEAANSRDCLNEVSRELEPGLEEPEEHHYSMLAEGEEEQLPERFNSAFFGRIWTGLERVPKMGITNPVWTSPVLIQNEIEPSIGEGAILEFVEDLPHGTPADVGYVNSNTFRAHFAAKFAISMNGVQGYVPQPVSNTFFVQQLDKEGVSIGRVYQCSAPQWQRTEFKDDYCRTSTPPITPNAGDDWWYPSTGEVSYVVYMKDPSDFQGNPLNSIATTFTLKVDENPTAISFPDNGKDGKAPGSPEEQREVVTLRKFQDYDVFIVMDAPPVETESPDIAKVPDPKKDEPDPVPTPSGTGQERDENVQFVRVRTTRDATNRFHVDVPAELIDDVHKEDLILTWTKYRKDGKRVVSFGAPFKREPANAEQSRLVFQPTRVPSSELGIGRFVLRDATGVVRATLVAVLADFWVIVTPPSEDVNQHTFSKDETVQNLLDALKREQDEHAVAYSRAMQGNLVILGLSASEDEYLPEDLLFEIEVLALLEGQPQEAVDTEVENSEPGEHVVEDPLERNKYNDVKRYVDQMLWKGKQVDVEVPRGCVLADDIHLRLNGASVNPEMRSRYGGAHKIFVQSNPPSTLEPPEQNPNTAIPRLVFPLNSGTTRDIDRLVTFRIDMFARESLAGKRVRIDGEIRPYDADFMKSRILDHIEEIESREQKN